MSPVLAPTTVLLRFYFIFYVCCLWTFYCHQPSGSHLCCCCDIIMCFYVFYVFTINTAAVDRFFNDYWLSLIMNMIIQKTRVTATPAPDANFRRERFLSFTVTEYGANTCNVMYGHEMAAAAGRVTCEAASAFFMSQHSEKRDSICKYSCSGSCLCCTPPSC